MCSGGRYPVGTPLLLTPPCLVAGGVGWVRLVQVVQFEQFEQFELEPRAPHHSPCARARAGACV